MVPYTTLLQLLNDTADMRLNLLDTLIILFASITLATFSFWAAGELMGQRIFLNLPSYLQAAADNLFRVLTSGAALSLLLYFVRRQFMKGSKPPPYLIYILGVAMLLAVLILGLARLLPSAADNNVNLTADLISRDVNQHEYRITGSFFHKGDNESLLVRGYGILGEVLKPTYVRLDFFRSGLLLASLSDEEFSNMNLVAVCRLRETQRLALLISGWNGAAGWGTNTVAAVYDRFSDRIKFLSLTHGDALSTGSSVECAGNQTEWIQTFSDRLSVNFAPCSCTFDAATSFDELARDFTRTIGNLDHLKIESFSNNTPDGDAQQFPEGIPVPEYRVTQFLDNVSRLGNNSGFSYDRAEAPDHEVLLFTYERPIFGSFQLLFVRRKAEDFWVPIYAASVSSKSFNKAELLGFSDKTHLLLRMCVSDCGWFGVYADVMLDVSNGRVEVIKTRQ